MDDMDKAQDHAQILNDLAIQDMRSRAAMPKGTAGECEYCGEHFERLVHGACGHCRDKYKLG